MTSSETSSQQQQQLSSSMHLQCVQANNHHHTFSTAPNNNISISVSSSSPPPVNGGNVDVSSIVNAAAAHHHQQQYHPHLHHHHHEYPINNNNHTTSSKAVSIVNSTSPGIDAAAAASANVVVLNTTTNHNNNETCDPTTAGLLTTTGSSSLTSSPSGASSTYLSCCSNLSVNGQNGGGCGNSLKISDNHLSAKLGRNNSAPYVINKQHSHKNSNAKLAGASAPTPINCDERLDNLKGNIMGSTGAVVNGVGGVNVICGMNGNIGGGGIKVEPNGNSIDINSVDNPLHLSTMHHNNHHHLHHSSNCTQGGCNGGGTGCCHHSTLGPINHFGGDGGSSSSNSSGGGTPNSNGMIENCDLDGSNNGNTINTMVEMSNGEMVVVSMDNGTTIFGRQNFNNNTSANNNSNTLVSPLLTSSPVPPGMTMVSCNSSNCNGNGVGATNTNPGIALNGGSNGPCVENNMSPGEDVDEHDCDDDKVINGDTFGAAGELPDPDSIKMFVGQIPKHMNETDLRDLFETYGRVFQINVLRDKATKQSKGCCFVTFFTRKAALEAQNALHNVKTLPGMNNTVQMKPADNENRYDRKLFIGMISKKLNEADVRNMFSRYGTIDDCTVLRLQSGESRGCAFITFATKQSAQNAIKAVHQSVTMEGCSSAIVVKFADTPKDKDQKRHSHLSSPATLLNTLSATTINPVQQQYFSALLHHQLQQQQQPQQGGFFSQLSPLGVQGITGLGGLGTTSATALPALGSAHLSSTSTDLATLTGLLSGVSQNPLTVQNLHTLAALGNTSLTTTGTTNGSSVPESVLSVEYLSGSGLQSGLTSYHGLRAAAVAAKQQTEGPEGCNLFIYHLPPECGDTELAQMFMSFGTVLSAKVFIDKQTNLSKCFGFVSFDNQISAQMAIQAMNGFQVGLKRLKVQLKRSKSKDAAKPY